MYKTLRLLSILFVIICLANIIILRLNITKLKPLNNQNDRLAKNCKQENMTGMLVNNPGCKIWDINQMDSSIVKLFVKRSRLVCPNSSDLPLTLLSEGMLVLNANATQWKANVHCEYRSIQRLPKDDWKIVFKEKVSFNTTLSVNDDFLEVKCFDGLNKEIYKNYHAQIIKRNESKIFKRQKLKDDKLNVLLIGIDSMSRLNFLRHSNKLHQYITTTMGGLELFGVNKVGYGTLANLTPLLSGKFLEELPWSKPSTSFDSYNFIWKNFSANGYATLYGEDCDVGQMFNYAAGGFTSPPVDHYLRPFTIAFNKILSKTCIREKTQVKAILNWVTEFAKVYQQYRYFGLVFNTKPTHDDINGMGLVVDDYYEFLKGIYESNLNEHTAIFIFGDHGIRQGTLRETNVGRYEAMLPFHYMIFPKWFKEKYPKHHENLLYNQRSLVTFFDIHETLQDLMKMDKSKTGTGSTMKRGISLFQRIPCDRKCVTAGVSPQYCMCHYNPKNITLIKNKTLEEKSSIAAVNHINNILKNVQDKCAHFTVSNKKVYLKHGSKDQEYLIVIFTVSPGGAEFEVTINHQISSNSFVVAGDNIDRINLYGLSSWCVEEKHLKLFCYCKHQKS